MPQIHGQWSEHAAPVCLAHTDLNNDGHGALERELPRRREVRPRRLEAAATPRRRSEGPQSVGLYAADGSTRAPRQEDTLKPTHLSPSSSMCRSGRDICVPASRYVCCDRVMTSQVWVSRLLRRQQTPRPARGMIGTHTTSSQYAKDEAAG
jgi:hypothetical protein